MESFIKPERYELKDASQARKEKVAMHIIGMFANTGDRNTIQEIDDMDLEFQVQLSVSPDLPIAIDPEDKQLTN